MTILEAIDARHSVRAYKECPLDDAIAFQLEERSAEYNNLADLHIQLIRNEPKSFSGRLAKYGNFSGVCNYLVMTGIKSPQLSEKIGYYGEQLVLFAQTLGLNTCWVGLTYKKVPDTYRLEDGEKVVCYIAIGYGLTQGISHKVKTPQQVSNVRDDSPQWFVRGVEAALKAPTAINQQKFHFVLKQQTSSGKAVVEAQRGFSFVGYTHLDLGIAKFHFETAAGIENFVWAE